MKSFNEPANPARKRVYDVCKIGFRSLIDTADANDADL